MGAKQRLYPEPETEAVLRAWCDQSRFLHNLSVEQFEFASRYRAYAARPDEAIKSRQHWPNNTERNLQLTELRAELDWLRAGSQKAQQQALRTVDRAYKNWWARPDHFRRPTFHSKYDQQSFGMVGRGTDFEIEKINRRWAQVRLPKVGWTKFRLTVPWERLAEARSCRVTIDTVGRWHISFPGPQPKVDRNPTGAVIGIDRGVTNTIATSDGDFSHIPVLRPKEAERLLRLERQLARQKKGSKRREKTRRAKAVLQAKQAARRNDWVEKTTTQLVRDNDVVVIERLKIKNMTKSSKGTQDAPGRRVQQKSGLNRVILASCWGAFETRLKQKAETCGVLVASVSAARTSQECAECGFTDRENRKSQSVFLCQGCTHGANADSNAAVVILDRGLATIPNAGGSPVSARGDLGLPGSVNREALAIT